MLLKSVFAGLLLFFSMNSVAQDGRQLIELLKNGGLTIFFRHSTTDGVDPFKINPPNENLVDCNTQRPLNEQGRAQARLIGQKFREHGIPVGDVFSSPVCRCEETAKLAFQKVTAVDWLILGKQVTSQRELERRMLAVPSTGFFTRVPTNKNNIYVGHAQTVRLQMIGPLFPSLLLSEGEGIVFDPTTKQYLGRISPSNW